MKIEAMLAKMERPSLPGITVNRPTAAAVVTERGPEAPAEVTDSRAPAAVQAVSLLNQALQDDRRDLRFRIDESTGRTVVQVVASDSGDVIRQIPGDEVLRMASMLLQGARMDSLGLEAWS
ncbi:MAG: flagellar protein FlaG [Gammaproteobacteria bacterium]|nr:flagellar protein FlaG [Gammaproteobacteria bacterium]